MSRSHKRSQPDAGRLDKPGAPPESPPEPINNPFLAARDQLQKLVPRKVAPPAPGPKARRADKPAAPPPPPPPVLSDADLFLQEMGGVRPLARPVRAPPAPVDKPPRPRVSEEAEVLAELADLCEGNGPWDIADTDEYIEGIAPGLDRGLLTRLRRGDFTLQGHIDLHGQSSEQARVTIERFLQEARLAGKRCVLIVHGRGLNSKDQIPVLKEKVRLWLTRGRIARAVLAFATARPTDGGAGAVYVLLRR